MGNPGSIELIASRRLAKPVPRLCPNESRALEANTGGYSSSFALKKMGRRGKVKKLKWLAV